MKLSTVGTDGRMACRERVANPTPPSRKGKLMKTKIIGGLIAVPTALGIGGAGTAFATPAHGDTTSTTLDACGYFVGEQTPATTEMDGATTTRSGTWTGVTNNYVNTPVASLGDVHGAFHETTTSNVAGDVTGTESFVSNAGKIDQTFTYGPDVVGGFNVTVTATRDLSFLTSSTAGNCYMGPFPRP